MKKRGKTGKIRKVLFLDSGTTHGQGGWQISRAAFEGLRSLDVEAELFSLSARLGLVRAAFSCLPPGGAAFNDAELLDWACGSLVEKALLFKPDLVLAMKGTRVSEGALEALRAAGVRTAAWTMDDPYELQQYLLWAANYDILFTTEPRCLPVYRYCGLGHAGLLPHAHDPEVHRPDPAAAASPRYASDVCFVGAAYPERVRLLKAALPLLSRVKTLLIGDWGRYRAELPGVRILDGFLPESEAARFYSGARIVLNIHRSPSGCGKGLVNPATLGADGVNSRVFEIAGCGAFQLADGGRALLKELFEPGREIETFDGPQELAAKVQRYLADEPARRAIGAAGRKRALADHTYAARMRRLLDEAAAAPYAPVSGRRA